MSLHEKIALAKDLLETAAFQVSSGNNLPQAHRNIVRALVAIEEIEKMSSPTMSTDNLELQEVAKVSRRLNLWAKRPEQMNARILKAFLLLSGQSGSPVTESALRAEVGESNFDINFVQMKNIADKNHGKVFDVDGDIVTIWPPVKEAVDKFWQRTKPL